MVSPCSSSSKQMAHSPESLDRMSSEKDNTDRETNWEKHCLAHQTMHQMFSSVTESCTTICLTFGTWIPGVICAQMRTGIPLLCCIVSSGNRLCYVESSISLCNSLMAYFNNRYDEVFFSIKCLPAYLAMTGPSVNTGGEGVTRTVFICSC